MISLDLNFHRKIKLWFSESNFISPILENSKIKIFNDSTITNPPAQTIIIELFLPAGARIIYGLLGIKYTPHDDNSLEILIGKNGKQRSIYKDSLINRFEPAYLELPDEYSKPIVEYLETIKENLLLNFKGKIDFCYAAHGESASNGYIFKMMTHALLALLRTDKDEINKIMIENLLDEFSENYKKNIQKNSSKK